MKGMLKQTGNELIKIWRQLGYRIVLFVIAGLMLAAPFMTFFFEKLMGSNFDGAVSDDYGDDIWNAFSNIQNSYRYTFFEENKLPEWKQKLYANELVNYGMRAKGLEFILNGKFKKSDVIVYFDLGAEDICEWGEDESPDEHRYDDEWIAAHYSEAKAKESYDAALIALKDFSNKIIAITEKEAMKEYLDAAEVTLANAENSLNEVKSAYEAEKTEAYKTALDYSQKLYDLQLMITEGWRFAYENNRAPLGWEYTLLSSVMPASMQKLLSSMPVSKTDYEQDPLYMEIFNTPIPYETYVRNAEKKVAYYEEAINVYYTAILKNAPLSEVESVSTKGGIRNTLMSFINLMSIFMVVLVAGIISSEFSSGSVRLLLIRPRSRTQIISAKLLASFIVYAASVIVMTVLLSAEHLMLFGIGDFFTGDVVSLFGATFVIPGFLMLLGKIFVASLPVLLYMSVAAVMAVLTRKNAVSIIVSLIIYISAATTKTVVFVVVGLLPNVAGWLVYTPLAYTDLPGTVSSAVTIASSFGQFDLGLITGGIDLVALGANLGLGIFYYIVGIVLFTFLTLLVFKKKQIKN